MPTSYTFLLSLLSFTLACAATPCDFPAIFNFGDSNSDTGGLCAAFGQLGPPFGESFFHGPAGRYSDGRLVIDFIAESLRVPYLSPFLDALGSNFSHGANFASAGATIRPTNASIRQSAISPFSLDVQFHQLNDFKRKSQIIRNKGGVFKGLLPKSEVFSRALYTIDIGQNDLINGGYFLNKTTDEVKAFIPDAIGQFKAHVKNIYDLGGRSFWIHSTGPLGCLPYVLSRLHVGPGEVDKAGCAVPYNEVAKYYNLKLKEGVVELRKELPSAALTYVDVYSVKYELFSQATKHGFDHPLRSCCGRGGKYVYNKNFACGSRIKVGGKELFVGKSCKDPSVAVVWDGVHYTQAANQMVFDQIVNGAYSDPPIPLKRACRRH